MGIFILSMLFLNELTEGTLARREGGKCSAVRAILFAELLSYGTVRLLTVAMFVTQPYKLRSHI